jgi:hypothetical protein
MWTSVFRCGSGGDAGAVVGVEFCWQPIEAPITRAITIKRFMRFFLKYE